VYSFLCLGFLLLLGAAGLLALAMALPLSLLVMPCRSGPFPADTRAFCLSRLSILGADAIDRLVRRPLRIAGPFRL
jgi:hypothetical protein